MKPQLRDENKEKEVVVVPKLPIVTMNKTSERSSTVTDEEKRGNEKEDGKREHPEEQDSGNWMVIRSSTMKQSHGGVRNAGDLLTSRSGDKTHHHNSVKEKRE